MKIRDSWSEKYYYLNAVCLYFRSHYIRNCSWSELEFAYILSRLYL